MSEKGKESAIKCFFVIIVVGEMAVCVKERESSRIWPKKKGKFDHKQKNMKKYA